MAREQDRAESRDEQRSLMHVKYLYMGSSLRTDNKFASTRPAYAALARIWAPVKARRIQPRILAFNVALEKEEGWRERQSLEAWMVVVVVVVMGWGWGWGVIRGVYAQAALCERGGFVKAARGRVAMCNSFVYKWTLTDMRRPLSTLQITATLQGTAEGRALGLPNPGSSLFHVLQLPTMLSWISRRSLSLNPQTSVQH